MASLSQICSDLGKYLRSAKQKSLKRDMAFEDIPEDDLDILFSYFGVYLVCELYGGNPKQQAMIFTGRLREKKSIAEAKRIDEDESQYEPKEPSGLGDWQHAERIKQKVFRSLEGILNQSASTPGHTQYVQAAKTLLEQAEKTKIDAAEVMMAYESQLLILAEHLVEVFLPKVGQRIKKDLRAAEKEIVEKLTEDFGADNEVAKVLKTELDKMIRSKFELKRYELMLAETMSSNKRISEAFDFTKDLIDNYKTTSEIDIEDKGVAKLKQFIGKRTSA